MIGIFADRIGLALGLLDHPDPAGRKQHLHTTPLVGGFAFLLAVMAAGGVLLWNMPPGGEINIIAWLLLAVATAFAVGVTDDRFDLGPLVRLGITTGSLMLLLWMVPEYRVTSLHFGFQQTPLPLPWPLWAGFTLLCLVGLQNAVNMSDGKNGLVIGQALIWCAVLAFRLPPHLLPLLVVPAAALAVLFWLNMSNRLFLGDGGSYAIATFFGLLAILAWNNSTTMRSGDIAIIFALPVLDTLRLMVQRKLQGKSAFTPGRDHLHHYLHDRWPWPKPLPMVLTLVALPNALAIAMPGTAWIWLLLTALLYALLLLAAQPRSIATRV